MSVVCCQVEVSATLSGRGLCDELITRPEESYRLCCLVVCGLETSRIGAPYIYDISNLRVNTGFCLSRNYAVIKKIEHIEEKMCTKCFLIHQKSELIRILASGERETRSSWCVYDATF